MPTLSIVKKYNAKSPLNGIIIGDKVTLESRDQLTRFLLGAQRASRKGELDYDIIDYSWAVGDAGPEVLVNPTGGRIGEV